MARGRATIAVAADANDTCPSRNYFGSSCAGLLPITQKSIPLSAALRIVSPLEPDDQLKERARANASK